MNGLERLSDYIVSFAGAAKEAQSRMSTGADPMTIKEYRFKAHITAEFSASSDGNVQMSVTRLSLRDKLSMDYQENMGIEVECTIVPALGLMG